MAGLKPTSLKVEYKENPRGIDVLQPRFSWMLESEKRGRRQSAYQVVCAWARNKVEAGLGDIWDSGKVASDQSAQVAYDGFPLHSRWHCWWRVRVWDENGVEGPWSDIAWWEMGLLKDEDWQARWIGFDEPHPATLGRPEPPALDACAWMALPGDDLMRGGPHPPRVYRGMVEIPEGRDIQRAQCVLSSGGQFTLFVNGAEAGASDGRFWAWRRPALIDVTGRLEAGENTLAIHATHVNSPMPASVIGVLEVAYDDGAIASIPVDGSWKGGEEFDSGWETRAFDDSDWPNLVEAGKAGDKPWGAFQPTVLEIPPCPYLRKDIALAKPVEQATVYASALGLYELRINGAKAGEDYFTPGWTDFDKRVYYNTYDVTEHLREGENALGLALGHGWYSGYLGYLLERRVDAERRPRALIQLEVTYTDGSKETFVTDTTWRAAHGPIIGSDFYMGEQYDARRELPGWDVAGFDDAEWSPVKEGALSAPQLQAYPGVPVQAHELLKPQAVSEPRPGVFILDLGQNMVGYVKLKVKGERGKKITLRFGEFLNPDGTLYVENLRGARCIDEYWLRGDGEEVWAPTFTFHGFRYVEITGYPETPGADALTGVVLHSATAPAGRFTSSHQMLNQLQSNILWGQKGNFLEVPTDCPQRDERLGWLGDAQVFCRTACFNMDTAAFFTKWMQDVEDAQHPNGAFPNVAPRVVSTAEGAPAWGDAGIIIPWTIYQCYGDTRLIEKHYAAMQEWIDYCGIDNPDLVRRNHLNNNYGDWLNKDDNIPKELIATAFFAYSARLLSKMATLIGREDDAARYERLLQDIKAAFINAFVHENGHIEGDTQTCYVLALHFDLLPEALRPAAVERLAQRVKDAGGHLTTGFVGCPYLLDALADGGRIDVAYQLLTNDTYPSWLYSVRHGATTIWERWDGWTEHGGFQDPGMNSFNHYAYGAVGDWMYRNLAGIDLDPEEPAYQHVIIRPRPGGGFTHAAGEYLSIRGPIATDWRVEDGAFTLKVSIPSNARATVYVPTTDADAVTEGGKSAAEAPGVEYEGMQGGAAVFEIGSGSYEFTSKVK